MSLPLSRAFKPNLITFQCERRSVVLALLLRSLADRLPKMRTCPTAFWTAVASDQRDTAFSFDQHNDIGKRLLYW